MGDQAAAGCREDEYWAQCVHPRRLHSFKLLRACLLGVCQLVLHHLELILRGLRMVEVLDALLTYLKERGDKKPIGQKAVNS